MLESYKTCATESVRIIHKICADFTSKCVSSHSEVVLHYLTISLVVGHMHFDVSRPMMAHRMENTHIDHKPHSLWGLYYRLVVYITCIPRRRAAHVMLSSFGLFHVTG